MKTLEERLAILRGIGACGLPDRPMWQLGGIAVTEKVLCTMSDNTFAVLRALMGVSESEQKERRMT